MDLDCRLIGRTIRCTLVPSRDLAAPLLVASFIGPTPVLSGGTLERQIGGLSEVRLPDLAPGVPHEIVFEATGMVERPVNRAFLPLGAWLRLGEETILLPAPLAGVKGDPFPRAERSEGLRLIPQPSRWEPAEGMVAAGGLRSDDPVLRSVDALMRRLGRRFLAEDGVPVTLAGARMAEGAYRLTIAVDGVRLEAGSEAGRRHAAVTLAQLLHAHGALPCGTLEDGPRFGWRGQHLDCARHFHGVETILHLLDRMALVKMNRFHWHFADDEAFRIETEHAPEIWQRSRLRGDGHLVPALFSAVPEAGGSYSRVDVARIVAHAADLGIEVLPEIEVPAHSWALAQIMPETLDPLDRGEERSVQGYGANVLNPAMPATWALWEGLVAELGDLFPFGHIHLGCDELPEDTWMGSPAARELMAREGLETTADLQGWTIHRLAQVATARGLRPAAWEEAARGSQGGIGSEAILFSWTGRGPGIEAARAGMDVVMCPATNVYLDMAQTADPDDWGANWAAVVGLAETVAWDVVPPDEPELEERILGVQGCFWGEFTTRDAQMWPMLFPRLLGVAEKAWGAAPTGPRELAALVQEFRDIATPSPTL